jgi:hypothetical protein
MTADDPEPQITARALLGLWHLQADSLRRHLDYAATPALLHELVTADVHRTSQAARRLARRSASWCCAWRRRTRPGDTAGCTAS